jgi:hypothetical protein
LENLTYNLNTPCVLDLKIGTQCYDDDATQEKMNYEISKFPFQSEIGFRFSGMKVWNGSEWKQWDRHWGRSIQLNDIPGAFVDFFTRDGSLQKKVISIFLDRLKSLETAFKEQPKYKFIASSLLFVYDIVNGTPVVDLRSIDFAHVSLCSKPDSGYLVGLSKIISYLEILCVQ